MLVILVTSKIRAKSLVRGKRKSAHQNVAWISQYKIEVNRFRFIAAFGDLNVHINPSLLVSKTHFIFRLYLLKFYLSSLFRP